MTTSNACALCQFWHEMVGDETGQCRRYAPRPAMFAALPNTGGEGEVEAVWPQTNAEDWCGEFVDVTPDPDA
jgi:hypothetical protein